MKKFSRSPAELRSMFGANLRSLSSRYPSISALARDLGINRTQFNRYLNGESFPRPDVLARICDFFDVDARVLLEPVENLRTSVGPDNSSFMRKFLAQDAHSLSEDEMPSGFFEYSRRSFMRDDAYIRGLAYVKRDGALTVLRGYEPKAAMAMQGIPPSPSAREFGACISKVEDGFTFLTSRQGGITGSLNFINRVPSFQKNFWVGYVARTAQESPSSVRITRMVYEHIGRDFSRAMSIARGSGFCTLEALMPFHQRLLQPDEPFR
ncbi:MAG: XRE family transcriptional regulator [Pseudomonadota bacterium]